MLLCFQIRVNFTLVLCIACYHFEFGIAGKSIIDYFKEVPDPRGAQGSRDDLWQILLIIIIMGIMSGYKGYRGLERFVERHRRTLIKLLALKQGTAPSYSTLRRMMIDVDYSKLNTGFRFNSWAQEQPMSRGAAIAGDGKSLRNTVSNGDKLIGI